LQKPNKKKITLVDWQIPIESQIGFLGGDVFTPSELQLMFHMNLNNIANFTFVQKPHILYVSKSYDLCWKQDQKAAKTFSILKVFLMMKLEEQKQRNCFVLLLWKILI
jgi:hypothetical protein